MDAAAALLALLLVLAALIWALGLRGKSRISLGALALLLAAGVAYYALPLIKAEPAGQVQTQAGELWQPWSADKVQSAHASGQPVFVDFTAAWCVTCQVNKRTTLSNAEVLAAFAQHQVQLLRADWTRQDPAITGTAIAGAQRRPRLRAVPARQAACGAERAALQKRGA